MEGGGAAGGSGARSPAPSTPCAHSPRRQRRRQINVRKMTPTKPGNARVAEQGAPPALLQGSPWGGVWGVGGIPSALRGVCCSPPGGRARRRLQPFENDRCKYPPELNFQTTGPSALSRLAPTPLRLSRFPFHPSVCISAPDKRTGRTDPCTELAKSGLEMIHRDLRSLIFGKQTSNPLYTENSGKRHPLLPRPKLPGSLILKAWGESVCSSLLQR